VPRVAPLVKAKSQIVDVLHYFKDATGCRTALYPKHTEHIKLRAYERKPNPNTNPNLNSIGLLVDVFSLTSHLSTSGTVHCLT